jgi:glycosyltransferase involved in cell wall biosynthesis
MRISVLHSRYLSGPASGENRVVEDEARLLREAGHRVSVWSPSVEKLKNRPLRVGARALWSREADSELVKMLERDRAEIVHCHNLFPMLSPSVLRTGSLEAAVVMTLHNYRLLCLPATFLRNGQICEACLGKLPWRGVLYRCYRDSMLASGSIAASLYLHRGLRTFEHVKLFLAVSEFLRTKHIAAGFSPERILAKPNFAWPTRRREGAGQFFLYLGRLSPEKGLHILMKAWPGKAGRLMVVGDGPELARLRELAPPTVEFRGLLGPRGAVDVLSQARALVLPSLSFEGSPRTVPEAYAAGVPVLASRIGALPELVDHEVNGLLVPPGDIPSWTDAIERLSDDREVERMGDSAWRTWREQYSPERGLAALEAAYRGSLNGDSTVRRRSS